MSEFQLVKTTPTVPLVVCNLKCTRDSAQISNLTTGTYNVDKIIHKNLTSYAPTTNSTQITISSSVICDTSNGNLEIELDPTAPLGCVLYILHDGGSNSIFVTGLLNDGVMYIENGLVVCFIKSTNGWVRGFIGDT